MRVTVFAPNWENKDNIVGTAPLDSTHHLIPCTAGSFILTAALDALGLWTREMERKNVFDSICRRRRNARLLVQIRHNTYGGQPRANTSVRFKMAPGRFEGVIERPHSQLSPLGGAQTPELPVCRVPVASQHHQFRGREMIMRVCKRSDCRDC